MALSVAWVSPRLRRAARAAETARVDTPSVSRTSRISLRATVVAVLVTLTAAVAVSAGLTVLGQRSVDAIRVHIGTSAQPAQKAGTALAASLADTQVAARSYLFTGSATAWHAERRGAAAAARNQGRLFALLPAASVSRARLAATARATRTWRRGIAAELAAGRHRTGRSAAARLAGTARLAATADRQFVVVRRSLDALSAQLGADLRAEVDELPAVERRAEIALAVTLALAVAATIALAFGLRRLLSAPLEQLVTDIGAVSGGVYGHPISTDGPREVALTARAVSHLRKQLLGNTRRLVDAQRLVTIRAERERMAADLHDLTLQDVYALGLGLTSLSLRHPELSDEVDVLVEDTRRMDRELRTIVFAIEQDPDLDDLTAVVTQLLVDGRRALGFAAVLSFHGNVDSAGHTDQARELLAALRESLSNIARHARATEASVTISLASGALRLNVTDNGVGPGAGTTAGNGLRNLITRAERLGGQAAVLPVAGGGTSVDWWVPLSAA